MEKQVRWFIWIFKLYDVELPLFYFYFFCDKSHVKNWITNQTNKYTKKKNNKESEVTMDEDEQVFIWREKKTSIDGCGRQIFFGKFILKKKKSCTFHSLSIFKIKLIEDMLKFLKTSKNKKI